MFLKQPVLPPFLKGQSVIFFGGDVNLGRRMNWNLYEKPFGNLPIMQEADIRIINLVSVAAAQGQQGIDKGEFSPYYYHARPEQINLLTEAQIDVALTANNHALDYYEAALLEQNDYLDRAGILHCGTGANLNEASRPLFIKVNKIIVALFNVDATTKQFAATDNKAGTFYLPPDKPELWKNFFVEKIAAAHQKADVVLVAPHWYPNTRTGLTEQARTIGNCHFNFTRGIETYNHRPIIYNTGNFLFDAGTSRGGGFSLVLSKQGVEQIFVQPLMIDECKISEYDAEQAMKIGAGFLDLCYKLNTNGVPLEGGLVELKFEPPLREEQKLEPVKLSSSRLDGKKIIPLSEPFEEWTVDEVPDDAKIEPQKFGAIKLVGCRVSPECVPLKKHGMLYVETYWTLDEPTDKNYAFKILGQPKVEGLIPNFGAGIDDRGHQPCDWMWPTNRWKSGVIYRERFGLRPPNKNDIVNIDLQLQISVLDGQKEIGKYISPPTVEIQIPDCPTWSSNVTMNTLDGNFDIETFKRELQANNGVVFCMLRNIKPKGSGIEYSAFRRAKMFRKYLGVEMTLITHEYQNDLLEQRANYEIEDFKVLNMYDAFQEINRDVEKTRKALIEPMHEGWKIDKAGNDLRILKQDDKLAMYCSFSLKDQKLSFINFFNDNHKKIRRDYYDMLGFLSLRQELDPENEQSKEEFYYRPDGTVAIHQVYKFVDKKNLLQLIELIDRKGVVTKTFTNRDDVLSYWLLQILNDKTKNYFLIGDRKPEWFKAYIDIKSAGLKNVYVIHQLHNVHVYSSDNIDPFKSATAKPYYEYLINRKIRSDAILSLTEHQTHDVTKRYYLSNVFTLPHPLPKVNVPKREVNPLLAVMVGRIDAEKCHTKAVDVFKIVLEKVPQAQLHFYGSGSLQKEVQAKIDSLGLSKSIIFKGFTNNIFEVFSSAAFSMLTSRNEGSPLVVQESLQCNCPVISFDCYYGPRDSIVNDINGYLVPVNDIKGMAEKIIKVFTEPGLREKLSANCAKSIEKFSPEVVASKWADFFCQLMRQDDNLKGA